ncbi:MAG: bifunctional 2-methylcitrate synthase/citrate synthase [Bdellovibrionaceae bacterium]|nr:bifunctional 2-methylcitrate synthase/citrate synthase [Pseudobdellovibrionaceae bacterium]
MQNTEIKKGLDGVIVDETSISKVMPDINSLVYRGYKVQDLAEKCSFIQVAYLLWHNELPSPSELKKFIAKEKEYRKLSSSVTTSLNTLSKKAHYMDTLRTAISIIGSNDERTWDSSLNINLDKAISLLAKIPTIIAYDYRRKKGLAMIEPDQNLNFVENFFNMCFGKIPEKEVLKAFEVSLVLYAEHSFNASTFTTRVISSTLSDLYSAVVGGVGALKGPLHGGANEQVMYMLKEIDSVQNAEAWMLNAIKAKKKVMGFGHRVYRKGDSRVPTMTKYAKKMAEITNQKKWMDISDTLATVMLKEKNIHPNLDFPAGPAYFMMGFEIEMFTPIFVMSRITGWAAHIMEQNSANRIIRPLSHYAGFEARELPQTH